MISKDQWAILEQHYTEKAKAVHPVRRYYEKLGMGIRTFPDLHYHKVRFYLPYSSYPL